MAGGQQNSEELCRFLETTLAALDEAAGDVDEESHQKLALLKATLQGDQQRPPLLTEASIQEELSRLDGCLSQVEEMITNADPLTKNLLGLSAEIMTKEPTDAAASKSDPPRKT